jgi:hypothetical protein
MRIGGLNSPITSGPDANGTIISYDPATDITTTIYSDQSSVVTANGTTMTYSTPQQLVQAAPQGASGYSWLTAITDALPKLATFVNAQQLAQINVQRAQQGKAALDTTQYGPTVGVSMSSSAMTTVMMLAGAAILLALLLKSRK